MFTLKFNDTADHAEHDWLVLKDGKFVEGFASSNAAERWIDTREVELAEDLLNSARQRRAAREATRVNGRLP
jgi:hypothetical protein